MPLTLIGGGRAPFLVGKVRVHLVAEDERLPFVPDAIAVEQDRYLALTPPKEVIFEDGNPLRTLTKALEVAALPIGTVHLVPGDQTVMNVVVIDVDEDPVCTPEWVEQGAKALLGICTHDGFQRLRLTLLGTAHGRISVDDGALALKAAMEASEALDVALVVPADRLEAVRTLLTTA